MTILGIDPGKSGAVAVLDEGGELLKVHDTPSTLEPNGINELRPAQTAQQ
jgi:predicted RNase H-like nuclease (RuvC/YqgF family)